MKNFPQLDLNEATREFQEEFGGYNHNLRIPENDFYDMKNMSGDYYPVLSTRNKRGIDRELTDCTGLICKDALCYIDNGRLYINHNEVQAFRNTTTSITTGGYTHVMVSMGAYLIVFRKSSTNGLTDGWFYNTVNSSEFGYIDNTVSISSLNITPCGYEGQDYIYDYTSDSEPTGEIANGAKWLDTSGENHVVKVWSASNKMWVSLPTVCVKLSAPNIANGFKEGDAVNISDLRNNIIAISTDSRSVVEQLKTISTNTIIQSLDEENHGWIVVVGILDESLSISYSSPVTISRQAPYMDYICEHNNRLWACRYGLNRNGDTVNEAYACKQNDFKNWNCYAGISTDSWIQSFGSEEVWTGCTAFGNSILFFKENHIHKVYGITPNDFQITEQKVRGIQRGSEKSLCFVNETLFYKSTTDICCYDGSTPVGISGALGEVAYSNAIFGSTRSKLYANMQDENGEWVLFVFDVATQMWHKEDNIQCKSICRVDDHIYYVDTNNILGTFTGLGTLETDFEWYAETGVIGYSLPDNKYIGRMSVRLKKPVTSDVRILIKYDDNTIWEPITAIHGEGIKSISIPILPKRCDHFRLRFEGKGECKIFSISKTIELGSDV